MAFVPCNYELHSPWDLRLTDLCFTTVQLNPKKGRIKNYLPLVFGVEEAIYPTPNLFSLPISSKMVKN